MLHSAVYDTALPPVKRYMPRMCRNSTGTRVSTAESFSSFRRWTEDWSVGAGFQAVVGRVGVDHPNGTVSTESMTKHHLSL